MKKMLLFITLRGLPLVLSSCCPKPPKKNSVNNLATQSHVKPVTGKTDTKEIIQQAYSTVVQESGFVSQGNGCCGGGCELSAQMGYTPQELEMFADANLGLGCGHPVSLSYINAGDTVLDLGSGAGLDCFLAAKKVGSSGKVIGIDMTQEMINKARHNAKKYNITNAEFRRGDIEKIPVEDNSIDVVMSNCVINLAPNKSQVFKEAYRVLKPGGVMAISDVVLVNELTPTQKNDPKLLCACVSGAILKKDYIAMLEKAGFEVTILGEDAEINTKWFGSDELPISSLKFRARKK
jgi:SAM-dependent methyltransferase